MLAKLGYIDGKCDTMITMIMAYIHTYGSVRRVTNLRGFHRGFTAHPIPAPCWCPLRRSPLRQGKECREGIVIPGRDSMSNHSFVIL